MRKINFHLVFPGSLQTTAFFIGAVVVSIVLFALITSLVDGKAVRDQESNFNAQQSLQTLVAGKGIEQHFEDRIKAANVLTSHSMLEYEMGSRSAESIEQLFKTETETYPEYLALLYVRSRNDPGFGYNSATTLGNEAQRVSLLWAWIYLDELAKHPGKADLWIPPMVVDQANQLMGLVVPVKINQQVKGVLVIVEDIKPVIDRYIVPMRSGQNGTAYLLDSQGNILFDHESELIGRNIFDGMHAGLADVTRIDRKILQQASGVDEYLFTSQGSSQVERNLIAWYSVPVGDQKLVIALTAPGSEIDTDLANFRLQRNLLSAALGILLLIASAVFFFSRQQILEESASELQQMVAIRTYELMTSEEALRSNNELLEALIRVSPLAIFQVDLNDCVLLWNPACERIFGWNTAEILGKSNPLVPVQMNEEHGRLSAGLDNGETYSSFETIRQRKDGTLIWVSISASALHDRAGKPHGRMAIIADINSRKLAEQALRESEQKFRAFIEESSEGFALLDENAMIIEWNPALEKLTGIRRSDILGSEYQALKEKLPEAQVKSAESGESEKYSLKGISNRAGYSQELILPNGSGGKRFLYQSVFPISVGERQWKGTVVHDVTLQKKAELEVLERNQELELIGTILSDLASYIDLNLIIRHSLDGTMALTGLESGSIYLVESQHNQMRFVTGRDGAQELQKVTGSLKAQPGEKMFRYAAETGKPYFFDRNDPDSESPTTPQIAEDICFMAVFPLQTQERVIGVLGLYTHTLVRPSQHRLEVVTQLCSPVALAIENGLLYQQMRSHAVELERRVSERTAQLQSAVHELESFSYSVSHDLRSPLRSISGFSQLLTEEYHAGLDEIAQNYLNRIRLSSQRMAELIDDLLNLARLSRAEMKRGPVNFSEMAQAVVDDLRVNHTPRNVDIQIEPGILVSADAHLLRVLLNNLLENAWKFTSRKENAVIEVGQVIGIEPPVYFVRDNGAGFDPRYANKLFGPFQRLHSTEEFEGTGIGLATVQRIVRRHGGQIWAEGNLDLGATFYFTLPAA